MYSANFMFIDLSIANDNENVKTQEHGIFDIKDVLNSANTHSLAYVSKGNILLHFQEFQW